jgi:hypothetical protein
MEFFEKKIVEKKIYFLYRIRIFYPDPGTNFFLKKPKLKKYYAKNNNMKLNTSLRRKGKRAEKLRGKDQIRPTSKIFAKRIISRVWLMPIRKNLAAQRRCLKSENGLMKNNFYKIVNFCIILKNNKRYSTLLHATLLPGRRCESNEMVPKIRFP